MPPSESNPRFRQWSKLLFFVLAKLVFNAILVATVLTILVQSDAHLCGVALNCMDESVQKLAKYHVELSFVW